jgi:hypothetical protein
VLIVARDGEALTLDLPVTRVAPQAHPELLSALGLDGAEVFQSVSGAEATAIILVETRRRRAPASPTCAPCAASS